MPFKKYISIIIKIVIVFFSFYFIYKQLIENKSFEKLNLDLLFNILIQNKPDHIHVATGLTVQVYNVFQVPEYYDFFKDYKLSFCDSFLLQTPKYLNISVFPDKFKDKLIKKLSSHWHDRSNAYGDYLQKNSANDKIRNKFYKFFSISINYEKDRI